MELPPELRELIYEWTFHAPDVGREQDLTSPHTPDKSLLLTCKTLHSEAWKIYRRAYRRFWIESKLRLDITGMSPLTAEVATKEAVRKHRLDVPHITSLRVVVPSATTYILVHKDGGWKASRPDGRTQYLRVRPWIARGERDPTRLAWDGHGDDRSLVEACEQCGSLPLVDQILRLPSLQL